MVSAAQSSTANKYSQAGQSIPRGSSATEKPKCRDEEAILSFSNIGKNCDLAPSEIDYSQDSDQIIEALKAENDALRRLLAATEESLSGAGTRPDDWSEQEREYTRMLEEKTDVIRELHLKIQELQNAVPEESQPPTEAPGEAADLCALSDELENERNQLKEDEKTLMQQMRAMEVQMSRERAEMARQRTDIERFHQVVRDELEHAAREYTLRDRLVPLLRQHREILRNGSSEPPARAKEAPPPSAPTPAPPAATSGIFKRFFGAGK
jgi:predicted RNase H-like nuclease (RuvC/YqgF family)